MKKKILLIAIIISFLFVPMARAETNEIISAQIIEMLNRLIALLTRQIELLQGQMVLQELSIPDSPDLILPTTTTTISPTTTTTTTTTIPHTTVITSPVIKPCLFFGLIPCGVDE